MNELIDREFLPEEITPAAINVAGIPEPK